MPGVWSGKNRFLADYGREAALERARWDTQQTEGELVRERETDTKNLWSMIGTTVAFVLGAGPAAPTVGTIVGNIAKERVVDESSPDTQSSVPTFKSGVVSELVLSEDPSAVVL